MSYGCIPPGDINDTNLLIPIFASLPTRRQETPYSSWAQLRGKITSMERSATPRRAKGSSLCFNALFRDGGCKYCDKGTCMFTTKVQLKHFKSAEVAAVSGFEEGADLASEKHCPEFFENGKCALNDEGSCNRVHRLHKEQLATQQKKSYWGWKSTTAVSGGNSTEAGSPPRPVRKKSQAGSNKKKGSPTKPFMKQRGLCWWQLFSVTGCKKGKACNLNHHLQPENLAVDIPEPVQDFFRLRTSTSERQTFCSTFFSGSKCPDDTACMQLHVLTLPMLNNVQQEGYSKWKQLSQEGNSPTRNGRRGGSISSPAKSPQQLAGPIKTQAERDASRQESLFPILKCKDEFVRRLSEEKVLVVTAATGSGKSTQLPQYAAEAPAFQGGLVVCTQPRAIAARSLAERIAEEFDGHKKGPNVGFLTGSGKEKHGERILLMTDSTLVRMAQRDRTLSQISVLIIDEAHERSLNTDLVIAISKLVLSQRSQDFHVVIASATINPTPFLQYYFPTPSLTLVQSFFGTRASRNHEPLAVPGKLHEVTLEELPVNSEDVAKGAFTSHLIKIVKKTLIKHTEGHCLVFLSGTGEIESAIKAFSKDKQDDWIPKPLYGSLPPEVQNEVLTFDGENNGRLLRMVCFCTNLAETSLTVPNVRIVIDTGLAKEGRFDAARRMNILEEVYISVASADQRKGRAGRTGPGHCVRLFDTKALVRDNIQPEIMRCSLDMVVLQLVKLKYDPLQFPFMDKPETALLHQSVTLLQELRCLRRDESEESSGTPWSLTPRGELFNQMPFDPRMSNFVVSAYEKGVEFLEPAAEVAAILTAPGSIFFLGGANKAEKLAKQNQISESAAEHDSDLLFMRTIYREWYCTGVEDPSTKACSTCGRKIKGASHFGCKRCRSSLAMEMSLNNKVLSSINTTVHQVVSIVLNPPSRKKMDPKSPIKPAAITRKPSKRTLEVVLGQSLAECFFDQICQLLLPSRPDAGVYLLEADEKGSISTTSSVMNQVGEANERTNSLYIAMTIIQIPNGEFKVEKLHRVLLEWVPAARRAEIDRKAFHVAPCYMQEHIAFECQRQLELHFLRWSEKYRTKLASGALVPRGPMPRLDEIKNIEPQPFADFVVCAYDQVDHKLYVYGPKRYASSIASIADAFLNHRERELLEYQTNEVIGQGTAIATFTAGLQMERIEPVGLACRVTLQNLPKEVSGKKTLIEFVHRRILEATGQGAKFHTIRWVSYFLNEKPVGREGGSDSSKSTYDAPRGIVVFATDASANAARKSLAEFVVYETDESATQRRSQRVASNETWGRSVLWKLKQDCAPDEVKTNLLGDVPGVLQVVHTRLDYRVPFVTGRKAAAYRLRAQNLPDRITEDVLRREIRPLVETDLYMPSEPKFGVRMACVTFSSANDRDNCLANLQNSVLASTNVEVDLPSGKVYKTPEFSLDRKPDSKGKATYEILFETTTAATQFVRNHEDRAQGFAQLDVKNASLFDVKTICEALEDRFDVEYTMYPPRQGGRSSKGKNDKNDTKDTMRVVFVGSSVIACGQACQCLLTSIAPLRVVVNSDEQQYMLEELVKAGQLSRWELELDLRLDYSKTLPSKNRASRLKSIFIYGDGAKQGELMRNIGEYATAFSARFLELTLGGSAGLFGPGRIGYSVLTKLQKEFKVQCSIEFNKYREVVQIYVASSVSSSRAKQIAAECNAKIDQVLVSSSKGKISGSTSKHVCIYCGMKSDLNLSICGHAACKSCLCDVLEEAVKSGSEASFTPVACRACGKRMAVLDLVKVENKELLKRAYQASARTFMMNRTDLDITLCPSSSCGAFRKRSQGYSTCTSCGKSSCLVCDIMNDDRHMDRTCEEYEHDRDLARSFDLDHLFQSAEAWVQANWDVTIAPEFSVHPNDSLRTGCPAFERYISGIVRSGGLPSVANQRMFAWHGTAEAAVGPICRHGFDPSRRSGQAYGVGEYFGQRAKVSIGYVRGSQRLIVAEIVKTPDLFKAHSDFCYVVNNPTDWSFSYNLPVLVLSFNSFYGITPSFEGAAPGESLAKVIAKLDPGFCRRSGGQARRRSSGNTLPLAPDQLRWTSPFRWYWWDGRKFEPYSDSINAMLEEAYMGNARTFKTPAIVRYLDDIPQEYWLKFRDEKTGQPLTKMEQVNCKTGYARAIQRERNDVPVLKNVRWTYSEGGRWIKFESSVQVAIEQAFNAYLAQSYTANSKCVVCFPGRPEKYELDFVQGTQSNVSSGTTRSIRRINYVVEEAFEEATIDVQLTPALRSVQGLTSLGVELTRMVEAATVSTNGTAALAEDEDIVTVSVRDGGTDKGQLVISMRGAAVTICALLVARVRTILSEKYGVVTPLRSIQAHGRLGRQMLQNPRLLQLTSVMQPPVWSSRDDVMLQLAHAIIWQTGCSIYGGFVRDWVLRGESANDIDVSIDPPRTTVESALAVIQRVLNQQPQMQFTLTDRGAKGAAHCLQVSSPNLSKAIEIDLVNKATVPFTPPGVDSDAGNVMISADGLSKKTAAADSGRISLEKAVRHVQRKEFVFFYSTSGSDKQVMRRLCKYLDRQWTCLSILPAECMNQLTATQQTFIRPKTKYNFEWWNTLKMAPSHIAVAPPRNSLRQATVI